MQRYYRWDSSGTTAGPLVVQKHYYRQESLRKKVRPRTTARQVEQSSWSGTTADQGRYYHQLAVLPLAAVVLPLALQRYYR